MGLFWVYFDAQAEATVAGDFTIKMMDFKTENDEFCTKTDEYFSLADEFIAVLRASVGSTLAADSETRDGRIYSGEYMYIYNKSHNFHLILGFNLCINIPWSR